MPNSPSLSATSTPPIQTTPKSTQLEAPNRSRYSADERELCTSPTWEGWSRNRRHSFGWLRRRSADISAREDTDTEQVHQRPAKLKKKPPAAMSTQKTSIRLFSLHRSPSQESKPSSYRSDASSRDSFDAGVLKGGLSRRFSLRTRKKKQVWWGDEEKPTEPVEEFLEKVAIPRKDPRRGSLSPKVEPINDTTSQGKTTMASAEKQDTSQPNSVRQFKIAQKSNGTTPEGSVQTSRNASTQHLQTQTPSHTPNKEEAADSESPKLLVTKDPSPDSPITKPQATLPLQSITIKPSSTGVMQPLRLGPGLRRSSEVRSRRGSRSQDIPSPLDHGVSSLELLDKTFLECCRCRRFFEAPPEFGLAIECGCQTVREVRKAAKDRGIEFQESNMKWHFAIRSDGRLRIYCFWCHHAMKRGCCEAWKTSLGVMERSWHPIGEEQDERE